MEEITYGKSREEHKSLAITELTVNVYKISMIFIVQQYVKWLAYLSSTSHGQRLSPMLETGNIF